MRKLSQAISRYASCKQKSTISYLLFYISLLFILVL